MGTLRSLAGAFALAVMASGPAAAETLTDALATAYRNSGIIEQNRAVLRAADEDVAQALSILRPALTYAIQGSYTDPVQPGADNLTSSASLNLSYLITDFGRSRIGVDAVKETVLATRAALLDAENTVLFNTVQSYMQVRRSQAFVNLRQNNVRLLTEQLRATRDRFEVGEVTRTDVSLAEATLASARSGLAAEQGALERAREQYKAVVGVYPQNLAPVSGLPSIPRTEAQARDIALRTNPLIDQVQHQVAALELRVAAAQRNRYPTLNATGSLQYFDNGDDRSSVGLSLSGPIYRGGALPSEVRQAQANRDAARAQLYTTSLLVEQEVGNAYAGLAVAIASIDASNREVQAANLALEGLRQELQLGARTTLEVLDQEQELLDAQTSRVSAQVDRVIAAFQVLDATGQLTAENLRLDVPIYDPADYYNSVKNAPLQRKSTRGDKLDRVRKALGRN